jgi:hypothetical protein
MSPTPLGLDWVDSNDDALVNARLEGARWKLICWRNMPFELVLSDDCLWQLSGSAARRKGRPLTAPKRAIHWRV